MALTGEEYIARYGASLSESDKRYILAFGPPQSPDAPGRNPSTPGIQVADAPAGHLSSLDAASRVGGVSLDL